MPAPQDETILAGRLASTPEGMFGGGGGRGGVGGQERGEGKSLVVAGVGGRD